MSATEAIEKVAIEIKGIIAPVLDAIEAREFEVIDDAETPGLQFNAQILGRSARVIITLMPTGDFKVYVADRETMDTLYTRTGVEDEDLLAVFTGDLQVEVATAAEVTR